MKQFSSSEVGEVEKQVLLEDIVNYKLADFEHMEKS